MILHKCSLLHFFCKRPISLVPVIERKKGRYLLCFKAILISGSIVTKRPGKHSQSIKIAGNLCDRMLFHVRSFHCDTRIKASDHIDQIGGTDTFSFTAHPCIRKIQPVRRLGQIHVKIQSLNIHLLPWCRCKLHPGFLQKFPVDIGNDASLCIAAGNISVVDSEEKQDFYLLQSGSLHITDHNSVHTAGNDSDLNLRKACIQNI